MAQVLNIPHGVYTQPIDVDGGTLTVNGPGVLDANADVSDSGSLIVNARVIGGDYTVATADLTFASYVSPNVEINFNTIGILAVDQPKEFHATLNSTAPLLGNVVDLVGLANSDAYTLRNDLLSILGPHGKVLDTVHLAPGSLAPDGVFNDQGSTYLIWGTLFGPPQTMPPTNPLPMVTHA